MVVVSRGRSRVQLVFGESFGIDQSLPPYLIKTGVIRIWGREEMDSQSITYVKGGNDLRYLPDAYDFFYVYSELKENV